MDDRSWYEATHDYNPRRPREPLVALITFGWMLGIAFADADKPRIDALLTPVLDVIHQ